MIRFLLNSVYKYYELFTAKPTSVLCSISHTNSYFSASWLLLLFLNLLSYTPTLNFLSYASLLVLLSNSQIDQIMYQLHCLYPIWTCFFLEPSYSCHVRLYLFSSSQYCFRFLICVGHLVSWILSVSELTA